MLASVVMAYRPKSTDSIVVVHEFICFMACGISPDQGSNPCLLNWQVNSLPLSHQGRPPFSSYILYIVAAIKF